MSTWQAAAASSPVLERLKKQGYEVIFALDQIDEIALQNVGKFDDVDVVDASKENADLGELSDDEKKAGEEAKEALGDTCAFIKEALGAKVDKVEVSTRLTSSPSALVQPQWGMSPQMQRFMQVRLHVQTRPHACRPHRPFTLFLALLSRAGASGGDRR